jgi:hypothetical protein
LFHVFSALPFDGSTGLICADNLQKTVMYSDTVQKVLPFKDLCFPLPKGSVGFKTSRHCHEDDNGSLIPLIWTSVHGREDL